MSRRLLIATRWVYRARYFSTCSGPPHGGLAYTTHSVWALAVSRRRNCAGVRQHPELAVEGELSLIEGVTEQREELAPEHAAEHAHREEEAWLTFDPVRAIGRDSASRHHAVHMRVVFEVLAPGVQDGQEPDLGPEVLRIGGDLLQGLGGGAEQKAVDLPRVLQGDRTEHRRESKYHMKIFDWQQLGFSGLHPLRRGGGLALGAVAVAARVVGDSLMPAPVALLDVSAQRRSPAGRDVAQGAAPLGRERVAVAIEEGITMVAEDIGHFELRSGHGCGRPSGGGGSRSNGLCVACRVDVETWV